MAQSLLVLVVVVVVLAFLLTLPLRLAAAAVGAGRIGTGWCFLALLAANAAAAVGLSFPVYGSLIAFLLASVMFAAVLDTSFLRGIAISILHVVFAALLAWLLFIVAGIRVLAA